MANNSLWTKLTALVLIAILGLVGLIACNDDSDKESGTDTDAVTTGSENTGDDIEDDGAVETEKTFHDPKTSQGLAYEGTAYGSSCYVVGIGTCKDSAIIIPEKNPEGKTVIGIQAGAFKDCASIVSIDIPSTVKKIDKTAFDGCTSLTTLNFFGSQRLWKENMKDLVLPANVNLVFTSYLDLTVLYRYLDGTSAGITDVYTFAKDTQPKINIPKIAGFRGDADVSLGDIIMTEDMTITVYYTKILAEGACGDNLLWTVYENGEMNIAGTGDMYDYINETTPWTPFLSQISVVTFGDDVQSIGAYAFADCLGIERIELPANLKSVGASAFRGWTAAQTVQFSGGVNILMMADAVWNSGSNAGITFLYGKYEQDGDLREKEAIEWALVTQEKGAYLLTTTSALEFAPFHKNQLTTNWNDSDLRKWIIDDFTVNAFTDAEKAVQTTATKGIGTLQDKVFVYSSSELSDLFEDESMRIKLPTAAAMQNRYPEKVDEDGNPILEPIFWWLRDSGVHGDMAVNVSPEGTVNTTGINVSQSNRGVVLSVWVSPAAANH